MLPALPIIYSFRRCPFAIRARLAIRVSNVQVELREVLLANKPKAMLECSPRGTVPVLVLPNRSVINESRDIMLWALKQHDPQHWLPSDSASREETDRLIDRNDTELKTHLDHYKYAVRFPQQPIEYYRQQAQVFLHALDVKLKQYRFLTGDFAALADMALLPFIRQFAFVDKDWFDQTPYHKLKAWLAYFLNDKLFYEVMIKTARWVPEDSSKRL